MKKSIFALAIGTFLLGMAEFTIEGILPDVSRDFAVSIPMAGNLISVYAIGVCVGALFLIGMRKFRPRNILLTLISLILLGSLLSLSAQSFGWLIISRFISGLPHGAYFGVGTIVAVRVADEHHKTTAVGLMCVGMAFANLLGVPAATYLSSSLSWRLPFMVIAFGGILALYLIYKCIPDLAPLPTEGFKSQFRFMRHLAPWLIIFTTMLGNGGLLAWYSYISPSLTELGELPKNLLPVFMILAGAGMVTGNVVSGWMSDRFKPGLVTTALLFFSCCGLTAFHFFGNIGWLSLLIMSITCICFFGMGTPEQFLIIKHSKGGEMLGGCCIQIAFNFGNAMGALLGGIPISCGYGYSYPALMGLPFVFMGFILFSIYCYRYERKTG